MLVVVVCDFEWRICFGVYLYVCTLLCGVRECFYKKGTCVGVYLYGEGGAVKVCVYGGGCTVFV